MYVVLLHALLVKLGSHFYRLAPVASPAHLIAYPATIIVENALPAKLGITQMLTLYVSSALLDVLHAHHLNALHVVKDMPCLMVLAKFSVQLIALLVQVQLYALLAIQVIKLHLLDHAQYLALKIVLLAHLQEVALHAILDILSVAENVLRAVKVV